MKLIDNKQILQISFIYHKHASHTQPLFSIISFWKFNMFKIRRKIKLFIDGNIINNTNFENKILLLTNVYFNQQQSQSKTINFVFHQYTIIHTQKQTRERENKEYYVGYV